MTLVFKLDLDMVKMYHHTKNEVFYVHSFKSYSPNRQTDRHTHTHMTKTLPLPHTASYYNITIAIAKKDTDPFEI